MRYCVVMLGIQGNIYRTPCETLEEAEELVRHHIALGWDAWVVREKVTG